MGDIIRIYWMESTIHPMPFNCDPMSMFVPNITVWESLCLSFVRLSKVLFRDESSPYSKRRWPGPGPRLSPAAQPWGRTTAGRTFTGTTGSLRAVAARPPAGMARRRAGVSVSRLRENKGKWVRKSRSGCITLFLHHINRQTKNYKLYTVTKISCSGYDDRESISHFSGAKQYFRSVFPLRSLLNPYISLM